MGTPPAILDPPLPPKWILKAQDAKFQSYFNFYMRPVSALLLKLP
jgi:hypothetical protein